MKLSLSIVFHDGSACWCLRVSFTRLWPRLLKSVGTCWCAHLHCRPSSWNTHVPHCWRHHTSGMHHTADIITCQVFTTLLASHIPNEPLIHWRHYALGMHHITRRARTTSHVEHAPGYSDRWPQHGAKAIVDWWQVRLSVWMHATAIGGKSICLNACHCNWEQVYLSEYMSLQLVSSLSVWTRVTAIGVKSYLSVWMCATVIGDKSICRNACHCIQWQVESECMPLQSVASLSVWMHATVIGSKFICLIACRCNVTNV